MPARCHGEHANRDFSLSAVLKRRWTLSIKKFYLSGLLSLLAGLAIVNLHNMWCADWRVIITVLGWLMTIGGILRIVVPQIAVAIGSIGTLGAFLSFKGYLQRA